MAFLTTHSAPWLANDNPRRWRRLSGLARFCSETMRAARRAIERSNIVLWWEMERNSAGRAGGVWVRIPIRGRGGLQGSQYCQSSHCRAHSVACGWSKCCCWKLGGRDRTPLAWGSSHALSLAFFVNCCPTEGGTRQNRKETCRLRLLLIRRNQTAISAERSCAFFFSFVLSLLGVGTSCKYLTCTYSVLKESTTDAV